jgi:hypothetical protein
MTEPLTGALSAQLVQQPKPPDESPPQVQKQEASRFDGLLVEQAQAVPPAGRVELEPLVHPPPSGNLVEQVVGGLERGQVQLDRLIEAGASGRQFSNAELLSLQASMYKYTLELDLTGKVVEKATNGLRDVLKTQV